MKPAGKNQQQSLMLYCTLLTGGRGPSDLLCETFPGPMTYQVVVSGWRGAGRGPTVGCIFSPSLDTNF